MGGTGEFVDLYWIPLGAGASSVHGNGVVYEAASATLQRRPRCDLYHSALEIALPSGRFMVEMTPVPDRGGARRGVVAEGSVGIRSAGRFRLFRYEVRRWRDGIVPDLGFAVASPVRVADDVVTAQAVFDAVPAVPALVWGRDESGAGEMWSCNSITSWVLTRAGIETASIALPPGGRAPGWAAGASVAALTPWSRDVRCARDDLRPFRDGGRIADRAGRGHALDVHRRQ